MIEAVNSVLSNASASRIVAEQQSASRNLAANPSKIQEAATTKAPYVSPAISIDKSSNKAVIQIRDSDTGDVVQQYPTEGQLKAYRTAQEFSERQKTDTQNQVREANGAAPSQEAAPTETSAPAVESQPAPSVETEA